MTLHTYFVRAVPRVFKLAWLPRSILAAAGILTLIPLIGEPPVLRRPGGPHVVILPGLRKQNVSGKAARVQIDCESVDILLRKIPVDRTDLAVFCAIAIPIQVR